ncbi:MAG: hypothetical protein PVF17_04850 [Ignavibacteria bacterium]|jgi:type IV secretory pathway VirB6-like protein
MKERVLRLKKGMWFFLGVLLVFVSVQATEYTFGHFDAGTIAIVLLAATAFLFVVAFLFAKYRDKKHTKEPAINTATD